MWLQLALCLSVGLAYGNQNAAWRENSEYDYEVSGRTLTSLHEISKQYSGIIYKAELKVQPQPDGRLQARISNCQYCQIQMPLGDGFTTDIPHSQLAWKPLPMSPEPFEFQMENGAVKRLSVPKKTPNWEANMIKGIVGQFQMKIAERSESCEEHRPTFKVMEDTVTGETETVYNIYRLPEHMAQQEPQAERLMQEKRDGEIYQVTKQKNYTNSVELPSYFYGFAELEQGSPATNKMGTFLTRGSFSRAILTGNCKRHTIQNAYTISEILVNPSLRDNKKGSVFSMVNVTLIKHQQQQQQQIPSVSNPIHLDSLVYSYGKPFDHSNEVKERSPQSFNKHRSNNMHISENVIGRLRRSLEEADLRPGSEENYKQDNQELRDAPESPLLRFTTGVKGQSIKRNINIVQKAKELAKEIANELRDSAEQNKNEGTLSKFTILTSLVRVMDANELQNVANELYRNDMQGQGRESWEVIRDSVAESGTGPALLAIQEWIQSGKIEGAQATFVLATMSRAVRQPSVQYVKTYFELIKDPKVLSDWPVNDTAILSFTQLLRRVYVDREHSAAQYPVKSFRNFRNAEGLQLLKNTVIPHLKEQLQRAVSQAQTHKIHVYIRALGNIGCPEILSAFEPYLEGDKQASQYQRLWMVLAMDRLAENYPRQALSALWRLYQNTAENQEIRVAAVFQIIRTKPEATLLQYMASYTNVDKHQHVTAAVKSSIETLSQLSGPEFQELRQGAEAAKPLLNKKTFGIQFGGKHLHQNVLDDLKIKYKEAWQFIGSEDQFYPKLMKYSLQASSAGLKKKMISVHAMISSIEELVHVFEQQTSSYSQRREQQRQNHQQQSQHQYSSQRVSELLGLQPEEREQLEGDLYLEGGAAESMLSFDNQTINRIIKEIAKLENEIGSGKQIHLLKMSNDEEMAVAFPTETGFPFLYTYDNPFMIKIEGHIKGTASPRIGQEKLQMPDTVQIETDLRVELANKIQGHISFITPFDHQQYVSGYNKYVKLHVPVKGKFELDTKKMQLTAELEREHSEKPTVLFHQCSRPFVSRVDIAKCESVDKNSNPNTHHIEQGQRQSFEKKVGQKQMGLALHVRAEHEKPLLDFSRMQDMYRQHGKAAAFLGLFNEEDIQNSEITITSIPQESTTRKCVINLAYQSQYRKGVSGDSVGSEDRSNPQNEMDKWQSASPEERQRDAMNRAGNNIRDCQMQSADVSIDFQGDRNIKYTMTGAYGFSKNDPKSKMMLMYRKRSDKSREESYNVALRVDNVAEHTNGLNMEYSIENQPKINSRMLIAFGPESERPAKIDVEMKFQRSEERKEFLKEQPLYKQCRWEMSKGNNQLPACVNVTREANLLDRMEAKMVHENVPEEVKRALKTLYYAARYQYFPSSQSHWHERAERQNELSMKAKFDPDLRSVNVSVATEQKELQLQNIPVNEWAKEVLVLHPAFSTRARIMAKALGLNSYGPFCVVDQTQISTFNNKTYPADVEDKWTVMLQYLPKEARTGDRPQSLKEQLKDQQENYVVLVKGEDKSSRTKEVKITLSSPQTNYQVVEITMTPRQEQNRRASVVVDKKEIQIDENNSYSDEQGYIQISRLPNGEVKAEIKDQFYVVHDGQRVMLTVLNGKFKDSTRGICGQFNNAEFEDFLAPDLCYTEDHHKFIKSYQIEGSQGQEARQELKSDKGMKCIRKDVPLYVDVVTSASTQSGQNQGSGQCTAFQTRYAQQNGEVCFTIRPMPVCLQGCQPTVSVERNVPVHCVQKSRVTELFKSQIDNGGSPDFSQKSESKTINFQIPKSCV